MGFAGSLSELFQSEMSEESLALHLGEGLAGSPMVESGSDRSGV